jgi:hypothetical protein
MPAPAIALARSLGGYIISVASRFGSSHIPFAILDSDRSQHRASPVWRSSLNGASQRSSSPSGPKQVPRIDPAVAPNESVSFPWIN